MVETDALDFELPPALVAQAPVPERPASRLMHYQRQTRQVGHRRFSELPSLLRAGDLLVFNDTRVLPARLSLRKPSGGRIEGLFLHAEGPGTWRVILKDIGGRLDAVLHFAERPEVTMRIEQKLEGGEYRVTVSTLEPTEALLACVGRMPLPPYIRRDKEHDARDALDRERYQTVFARLAGAVAAPTAALHFSQPLLEELDSKGIQRTFVTLHVGAGTFKPVTARRLEEHSMHREWYSIGRRAADALNAARREDRRIIAVGTTSARVLESQPADQPFTGRSEETGILIYPPYQWKHVSALITNFHLPRSTLIALVAAMVGLDEQRRLYRIAVEQGYRFFSYGDAMLIE